MFEKLREMQISQKNLASYMGVGERTVMRWKKDSPPKYAEELVDILYDGFTRINALRGK